MSHSITLISPDVPADIVGLLSKPALLPGEDPNHYDALFSQLAHSVKPADIMEWLWVRDITDLTWDTIRYRRLKTMWIKANNLESPSMSTHVSRLFGREMSEFRATISAFGSLQILEHMQASAEFRRNNTLREIESRRLRGIKALSSCALESLSTTGTAVVIIHRQSQGGVVMKIFVAEVHGKAIAAFNASSISKAAEYIENPVLLREDFVVRGLMTEDDEISLRPASAEEAAYWSQENGRRIMLDKFGPRDGEDEMLGIVFLLESIDPTADE